MGNLAMERARWYRSFYFRIGFSFVVFVVLSGLPFSVYTQVLETYIDGQRVYERKQDWPYQAGGFALRETMRHGMAC